MPGRGQLWGTSATLAYGEELDVLVNRSRKDDECELTLWLSSAAASQSLPSYCTPPQRPLSSYVSVQYCQGWRLVSLLKEIPKAQSNSMPSLKAVPVGIQIQMTYSGKGVIGHFATHGMAHSRAHQPSPCPPQGWGSSQGSGMDSPGVSGVGFLLVALLA